MNDSPSSNRSAHLVAFLAAHGFADAERRPLAGDASFRRYERIDRDTKRAVLMDAPPAKEDVRPFVRVARHLKTLGFSAPEVIAADEALGALLLEDLGDDTFTRALAQGGDERALYTLAVDVLIALHRLPPGQAVPADTPPYDHPRLLAEAMLLAEWYLPAVTGGKIEYEARQEYVRVWMGQSLPSLSSLPTTLVLRDFHVDNLMRLAGREGIGRCGLLDFQDAVEGPRAYDLMSLVEDARRDIDPALAEAMTERYLAAFPDLDRAAFLDDFAILAAQRHAKVIGIFTRLCVRDGKPGYLAHIPRLWRLLERRLAHPSLGRLAEWIAKYLPPERRVVPSAGTAKRSA